MIDYLKRWPTVYIIGLVTIISSILLVKNTTPGDFLEIAKQSFVYSRYVEYSENIGGVPEETIGLLDVELPEWNTVIPIVMTRFTQRYTDYHRGLDIVNDDGNLIITAISSGEVIFAGWQNGYGYRIEINHWNGFISTYSHLSAINVKTGDWSYKASEIGLMGGTGETSGPHLHFEILYKGIKINPEIYLK